MEKIVLLFFKTNSFLFFFSRDKVNQKVTVVPLQKGAKIGQRAMLSQVDCMKLNHHYGCFDASNTWVNNKIRVKCSFFGYNFKGLESN